VLFRGELNIATAGLKCKMFRFVEGSNHVPHKVLHHFPLIPRLKQMYKCSSLVELMTSYNANKNNDGLVRFVCDSKA
jgi:hypothetical protein